MLVVEQGEPRHRAEQESRADEQKLVGLDLGEGLGPEPVHDPQAVAQVAHVAVDEPRVAGAELGDPSAVLGQGPGAHRRVVEVEQQVVVVLVGDARLETGLEQVDVALPEAEVALGFELPARLIERGPTRLDVDARGQRDVGGEQGQDGRQHRTDGHAG